MFRSRERSSFQDNLKKLEEQGKKMLKPNKKQQQEGKLYFDSSCSDFIFTKKTYIVILTSSLILPDVPSLSLSLCTHLQKQEEKRSRREEKEEYITTLGPDIRQA